MTAPTFITEHLDIWSAALSAQTSGRGRSSGNKGSYGIQKLRELILELAVRGQLVPQDPSDEPASALLRKIRAEKDRLIKAGKIKKDKPLPAITDEEKPFALPSGWEWIRFGDALVNRDAERKPVSSEERQFMQGEYDYYGASGVIDKVDKYLFDKPLLLIGEDGANLINRSTPIAFIARGKYWVNNHAHVLDGVNENFLRYIELFINAIDLRPYVTGTAQPKMNQAKMNEIVLVLPPEREQHRIVAKVDELMALCDRLEAEQSQAADTHEQLVSTLLDALVQGDNFVGSWAQLHAHFDLLFTTPASIDKLKQTILQLAVMGKLVPQDPKDEPASELLKKIRAEKDKLIKAGKIRKDKIPPNPPLSKGGGEAGGISDEEKPFALPSGWEWVRFSSVADSRLGKMLDKAKNRGIDRPYLRNTNVQWFGFELEDLKNMRFEEHELDEYRVVAGDLIICEGGEPGRCAIWREEITDMFIQKALHRARAWKGVLPEYLQICLWVDSKIGYLERYFTGVTIKHFSGEKLAAYTIALPPAIEQNRIVAKVDELMALCDQLKAKLEAAGEQQRGLADGVIRMTAA